MNVIDPDIIIGNLTATIFDHLPQFLIIFKMFGKISGNQSKIFISGWFKCYWQNFIIDYFYIENSTNIYLDKINMLLDTFPAPKIINKYKLKFKSKPWITLYLQTSVSMKNKLLSNFINKKDSILEQEFHTNYKKLLCTLMKKS